MDLSPLRSNLVRPEIFSYTLSSILPINFSLSLSAWLKSRITQFFYLRDDYPNIINIYDLQLFKWLLFDKILRSHIKQPLSIK